MANPSFVTKALGVRLDRAALERITTSEGTRGAVRLVAEAVARVAEGTVGEVDGHRATAVVYDDTVTPGDAAGAWALSRRRLAVLMKHPTPAGREAGARALLAAIDR